MLQVRRREEERQKQPDSYRHVVDQPCIPLSPLQRPQPAWIKPFPSSDDHLVHLFNLRAALRAIMQKAKDNLCLVEGVVSAGESYAE